MSSMPTYKEIQECASQELGIQPSSVKTCCIAKVKREMGLTERSSWNSSPNRDTLRCPPCYFDAIGRCIVARLGLEVES